MAPVVTWTGFSAGANAGHGFGAGSGRFTDPTSGAVATRGGFAAGGGSLPSFASADTGALPGTVRTD
ncbi:hypothetical protein [Methylobacterium sp. WSM2598]|uniref:hypothetical protein n=1 Tax=Methylobacterium sp. WSM2598 TaxID=398261 RepID=UPI00035FE896|nr:hypothetical protein [Methylobacterium sp. WSM2598]